MTPGGLAAERGFSLLEAIVALVVIASSGLALYSWINSNLISLARIEATARRAGAVQNALDLMAQINPAAQTSGNLLINGLTIEWNAEELEPLRDGVGYPGGIGLYQIGLFDTEVRVSQEEREIASFTLRQVGYEQVREFRIPF
jgi:general secretion pathway protein I